MKIVEVIAQAQIKYADGTMAAVTTPPLEPDDAYRLEDVIGKLMELGENILEKRSLPGVSARALRAFEAEE